MKVVTTEGFICVLRPLYGSVALGRGVEGHGSVAAGDRVVARRCGFGEVEVDNTVENGTGEPGRAGADTAGVSRGSRMVKITIGL
jgi:hypothetical protein